MKNVKNVATDKQRGMKRAVCYESVSSQAQIQELSADAQSETKQNCNGLLICAKCGRGITAEQYNGRYTYYRGSFNKQLNDSCAHEYEKGDR